MGRSKAESFGTHQRRLAELGKALGHPARIAILEVLAERNACVCGMIVDQIPLAQATVSQHLAELKRVGLIKGEIGGPSICYCIDRDGWDEARRLLTGFLKSDTHAQTSIRGHRGRVNRKTKEAGI